mgnify:CR=1 FL=1
MTLYQISFTYRADAAVLRTRISELRAAARAAQDREEAERLKRRIAELQVLRRQSSELAELTKAITKGTITAMKGTPYSIRNNEFYGDMAAWLRANAQDNDGELLRLKRNLRLARQEALTARQRQLLRMNFEQNKTVTEIAQELGVNKSTVSRTLLRAKRRLYQCLRYAL